MIVERITEHSGDLLDLECGLMTSPMNLGYFYGDSPASSDQSGSPQSHYSPCSPNSDSESSSSWSSAGCYANPDGTTENGQSPRGGGKQQNKAFQGVRVKNPVKELLMNKRSNQMSQSPQQEHNQVQWNTEGPEEFKELKTILREGKRHASESVFDAFSYKRAAPFRLLTPPQTPTSIEIMDSGQRIEPRSSEANPNILNIIQMVNDNASQVSLTTVQFNGGNPSQDHQRDQYYESYGGQVSMEPQVSSRPQARDLDQMFPFYSPAQMQEFPYTSPCLASDQSPGYPATQPDILQFNIPSQVGNQEEQQNPLNTPSIFSSPAPRLDPQIFSTPQLPSKCPQIPQEPGGMSFFQWQIEQEDRKLANITQEHLISKDSDGDTFLHIAVAQGRRALSYVLARKMASFGMLDVKEHNGQSALQVAVAANQHLIVQDLLSLGAQINTADCWGRTPLHVCAEKGHAQAIQAIQKGVLGNGQQLDLEAINYDGMTALHRAVVSHNAGVQELQKTLQPRSSHIQGLLIKNKRLVDCIKTLLQMGATIHAKDRKSGRTAVHIAAEEANVELLQLFLDQPDCLTIVNTKLYNGNTALHIAASLQNRVAQLDAVRLLMRKGADPSTRNLENEQPQNLVPDGPVGEKVRCILKGKAVKSRGSPF
ncbi:NF-kappa-B inhibitor zeta-like [Acipenser oxyrinchus oxyrinchus]|uniref:NF-kappa-B inhibitor zeta-like n=1 Tax=Acipenser oxyrinchus oxyrinchus TaxID=40147 RepID=A0AAD8DEV8_ACIOX|nr:NF-kappa-B inhibitor zeta-like [Acipenser oxyrinchus oxyrinchus]